MTREYGVLNNDAAMANDAKRVAGYLRAKRAWFIIDKTGVIRYAKIEDPRGIMPNDELLEALQKIQ